MRYMSRKQRLEEVTVSHLCKKEGRHIKLLCLPRDGVDLGWMSTLRGAESDDAGRTVKDVAFTLPDYVQSTLIISSAAYEP